MYTCGLFINANLVKEGGFRINAKLVKEELKRRNQLYFVFNIFYQQIAYQLLNMLKIKCETNQQDLKIVHLHFIKSD